MPYYINCKNCGKQTLMNGYGPDEECLFCGMPAGRKVPESEVSPAPASFRQTVEEKPTKPSAAEKLITTGREYYQAHKKEMIEDLLTMNMDDFYKKWPVKRQQVAHLKSNPLYRERVAGKEATQELKKEPERKKVKHHSTPKKGGRSLEDVAAALKRANTDKLPSFPEWTPEKWTSSEIAVQWLRTYEALQGMQLVLLLSQNIKSAPAAPAGKAKGNYTGDGTANRVIAHGLGVIPRKIRIKV